MDTPTPALRTRAQTPHGDGEGPDLGFLAPPEGPDELGRLGPYRVRRVLGSGGMGMVLLADDPDLRRRVALKVMLPHADANPVSRERFVREARAAALLEHDNVVPVYQVGVDRGVPYIAMPYLKGMNLEDYLRRRGGLTVGQVLRIAREAARGLAAAHAKGLIHRDIKPANLWLDSSVKGRVRILDFGLARWADGDERLTADGAVMGTPAYMAPEQAAGKSASPASDLFSLGAVLYRLAGGRRPFSGDSPYAAFAALATETPVPLGELNPELPPAFADLVMRLIEKEPGRRPPTAVGVAALVTEIERRRARERAAAKESNVGPIGDETVEPSDAQFQLSRSNDRTRIPSPPSLMSTSIILSKRWPWGRVALLAVVFAVLVAVCIWAVPLAR